MLWTHFRDLDLRSLFSSYPYSKLTSILCTLIRCESAENTTSESFGEICHDDCTKECPAGRTNYKLLNKIINRMLNYFGITNPNDYIWVKFNHFWFEHHFLRQLGSNLKPWANLACPKLWQSVATIIFTFKVSFVKW